MDNSKIKTTTGKGNFQTTIESSQNEGKLKQASKDDDVKSTIGDKEIPGKTSSLHNNNCGPRDEQELEDYFKLDINSFIARVMLRPPPSPPRHDYENIWIDENHNSSQMPHSTLEKRYVFADDKSSAPSTVQNSQINHNHTITTTSPKQQRQIKKTVFGLPGPEAFLNLITIPEHLPSDEIRVQFGPIGLTKNYGCSRDVDFTKILGGLYSSTDEYKRALLTPLEEDYAKLVTPPPPPPPLNPLTAAPYIKNNSNSQNFSQLPLTASSTAKLKETISTNEKMEISGIELTIPLTKAPPVHQCSSIHTSSQSLETTNSNANLSLNSKSTPVNQLQPANPDHTPLISGEVLTDLNKSKNRHAAVNLTSVPHHMSDSLQSPNTRVFKFTASPVVETSFSRPENKHSTGVRLTDANATADRLNSPEADKYNQLFNTTSTQMSSIDQTATRKLSATGDSECENVSKEDTSLIKEQNENVRAEGKELHGSCSQSSYLINSTSRQSEYRPIATSTELKERNFSTEALPSVVRIDMSNCPQIRQQATMPACSSSSQSSSLSNRNEPITTHYTSSEVQKSTRMPLVVQKRSLTAPISRAIKHCPPVPPRSSISRITRSSTSVPTINSDLSVFVPLDSRTDIHNDNKDINEFRSHSLYSSPYLRSFRKCPTNTSNPEISFHNKAPSEVGSDVSDLYNSGLNLSSVSSISPQGTLTRSTRMSSGVSMSPDGTLRPRRLPPPPPPRRLKMVQSLTDSYSVPISRRTEQHPICYVTSIKPTEVVLRRVSHDRSQTTGKQDLQARLSNNQRNSYIKMSQNLDNLLLGRIKGDDLHSLRPGADHTFRTHPGDDLHSLHIEDGSDIYPAQIHPNRLRVSTTSFTLGTNVTPTNQILILPSYGIRKSSTYPDDAQSIASSSYSESRFIGNSGELKTVPATRSVPSSPLAVLRSKFKSFWSPAARKRKSAQRNSIAGSVPPPGYAQNPPTPPITARHGFRKKVFGSKTLDSSGKVQQKDGKNGEDFRNPADDEEFILTPRDRSVTCEEDIKSCGNIFATVEEIPVFHRTQPSSRGVVLRREAKPIDSEGLDIRRTNWHAEKYNDSIAKNRNRNSASGNDKLYTFTGP